MTPSGASRILLKPKGAIDARLFGKLSRAVSALGKERIRATYQTTFWFDFGPPSCLPERAVLSLRRYVPPSEPIAGVEWWLSRMRTTNVRVDFHQDRDEHLALRTGRLVHPLWSSVFFLNRCKGGLLAITDALPNPKNPSHAPDDPSFDLVEPAPNRFVRFAGHLTHGVLDAENQIPHRRLPGTPPFRRALIVNWWRKRPEGVPRWSESHHYAKLAL